jgi:long-chain acyl-CoA synthetase
VRDLMREVLAAEGAPPPASRVPAGPESAASTPSPALRLLGLALFALNRVLMRTVFRLRVKGLENLPAEGPLLIAPNHASYLDPMALAAALPWRLLRRIRWAGWTEFMFRAWHWRLLSRATGVFPVDPDRDAAAAITAGQAVLAQRQVLTWFPEGRRSLTGELGRFLPGVGVLLSRSASPVVPVRITGSFYALPWNRRWPRPVPIAVTFGPAMSSEELAGLGEGEDPAERVSSGLRRAVAQLRE